MFESDDIIARTRYISLKTLAKDSNNYNNNIEYLYERMCLPIGRRRVYVSHSGRDWCTRRKRCMRLPSTSGPVRRAFTYALYDNKYIQGLHFFNAPPYTMCIRRVILTCVETCHPPPPPPPMWSNSENVHTRDFRLCTRISPAELLILIKNNSWRTQATRTEVFRDDIIAFKFLVPCRPVKYGYRRLYRLKNVRNNINLRSVYVRIV